MRTRTLITTTALVLASTVALSGCTADAAPTATETPAASATPSPTPTPTPTPTTDPVPKSEGEAIAAAVEVAGEFYAAWSTVRQSGHPSDTTPIEPYADQRGISSIQNLIDSQAEGGYTVSGDTTFSFLEDADNYVAWVETNDGSERIDFGTAHIYGCVDNTKVTFEMPGEEAQPAQIPHSEVQLTAQYLLDEDVWKIVSYRQMVDSDRCEK